MECSVSVSSTVQANISGNILPCEGDSLATDSSSKSLSHMEKNNDRRAEHGKWVQSDSPAQKKNLNFVSCQDAFAPLKMSQKIPSNMGANLQFCPPDIKLNIAKYFEGDATTTTRMASICKAWSSVLIPNVACEKTSKHILKIESVDAFNVAIENVNKEFGGIFRDRFLTEIGRKAFDLLKNKVINFNHVKDYWFPVVRPKLEGDQEDKKQQYKKRSAALDACADAWEALFGYWDQVMDRLDVSFEQVIMVTAAGGAETLLAFFEHGPAIMVDLSISVEWLVKITVRAKERGAEILPVLLEIKDALINVHSESLSYVASRVRGVEALRAFPQWVFDIQAALPDVSCDSVVTDTAHLGGDKDALHALLNCISVIQDISLNANSQLILRIAAYLVLDKESLQAFLECAPREVLPIRIERLAEIVVGKSIYTFAPPDWLDRDFSGSNTQVLRRFLGYACRLKAEFPEISAEQVESIMCLGDARIQEFLEHAPVINSAAALLPAMMNKLIAVFRYGRNGGEMLEAFIKYVRILIPILPGMDFNMLVSVEELAEYTQYALTIKKLLPGISTRDLQALLYYGRSHNTPAIFCECFPIINAALPNISTEQWVGMSIGGWEGCCEIYGPSRLRILKAVTPDLKELSPERQDQLISVIVHSYPFPSRDSYDFWEKIIKKLVISQLEDSHQDFVTHSPTSSRKLSCSIL